MITTVADPETDALHRKLSGAELRRRRVERGLTEEDVAAHLDCTSALVRDVERGQHVVGLDWVIELTGVLGIDPREHFERVSRQVERRMNSAGGCTRALRCSTAASGIEEEADGTHG
ncbi:helix-turn-helix domain-containing protein [Nocardia sp. XZ_19_369]|uniref:helix-turn-helix domain-containing protein n=1 Tax=Nocardia sp. XZ_19_369 TaxID=2769487 RepID=UPI00188EDBC9|nr:helix-turn-helix transcriptional regulator [Nocardia sp. XZ_19_369]